MTDKEFSNSGIEGGVITADAITSGAANISDAAIITMRPNVSRLKASPYLTMEGPAPMPNRWRRFWYWALLGWKWERV